MISPLKTVMKAVIVSHYLFNLMSQLVQYRLRRHHVLLTSLRICVYVPLILLKTIKTLQYALLFSVVYFSESSNHCIIFSICF